MVELNPSKPEDFNMLIEAKILQGRFEGLSLDDYHRNIHGVSKTDMESAALSPANMIQRRNRGDMDKATLRTGSALHCRLELWPDKDGYQKQFIAMPEFAGTGSKAAKAEWIEANKDRVIVDDGQMIEDCLAGVLAHPQAREILEAAGFCEETFFWKDSSGVICKCRPDKRVLQLEGVGKNVLVDWKTIGQFSVGEINKAIGNYNYHVSAAFSIDGVQAVLGEEVDAYVFAFIEKERPNRVALVACDPLDIELGHFEYKRILTNIAGCERTGIWPGFVTAGLPEWKRQLLMKEMSLT